MRSAKCEVRGRKIRNPLGGIETFFRGDILRDEPLCRHTSYRIGGPADLYLIPADVEDAAAVVRYAEEQDIPRLVIGNGTNLLVSDAGIRGIVMDLHKACGHLRAEGYIVRVGAAVSLRELTRFCEERGLGGLDFLSGIPGTVGGALRMNAGAFTGEVSDPLQCIQAIDRTGRIVQLEKSSIDFGYRRADGLESYIVTGATFALFEEDPDVIAGRRQEILQRRSEKQPLEYPSAGSVFKRPQGDYAGRLIEAAGCKGWRVGDAMVSPKHANFIVNLGHATASDVLSLIRKVQIQVREQFDVELELEIKLVGDF